MEKTTIQISKETLERLKQFKDHPMQSYDVTINFLLDDAKDEEFLTPEEARDVEEALKRIQRGEKTIPIEEVAKKYGVKLD
mgnify:CR=1 FL=1